MGKATHAELAYWIKEFESRRSKNIDRVSSDEITSFFKQSRRSKSLYARFTNPVIDRFRTVWIENHEYQLAWLYEELHNYAESNGLTERNRNLFTNIWQIDPDCCSFAEKGRLLFECFEPRVETEVLLESLCKSWRTTRWDVNKSLIYFRKASSDKLEALISVLKRIRLSSSQKRASAADCIQERICYPKTASAVIEFTLFTLSGNSHSLMQDVVRKTKDRYRKQTYNQKNKERKQFNIMLNANLVGKLDQLIKNTGLSRSEVLERLIEEMLVCPTHNLHKKALEKTSQHLNSHDRDDRTSIEGPIGGPDVDW